MTLAYVEVPGRVVDVGGCNLQILFHELPFGRDDKCRVEIHEEPTTLYILDDDFGVGWSR